MRTFLVLVLLSGFFISCEKETYEDDVIENSSVEASESYGTELAFPDETGLLETMEANSTNKFYPSKRRIVSLYRYYNASRVNHFYTTNYRELGGGTGGYKYEGIQCKIYNFRFKGTVPLYRYYNASRVNHFYTTNYRELGGGKNGYKFEGVAGYVFPSPRAGHKPLYRYYNHKRVNHFYTTNYSELGGGKGGYKYEGIAGYVLPKNHITTAFPF